MVKKTITFENYMGEEITEDFYFHLNEAELFEIEMIHEGGLKAYVEAITKTKDAGKIIEIFKKLICMSYGVKSPDGRKFIKNENVLNEFIQTGAYSKLFIQLATNAEEAAAFVNGMVPKKLNGQQAINQA